MTPTTTEADNRLITRTENRVAYCLTKKFAARPQATLNKLSRNSKRESHLPLSPRATRRRCRCLLEGGLTWMTDWLFRFDGFRVNSRHLELHKKSVRKKITLKTCSKLSSQLNW